ncbi:hypothetical protein SAMN05192574_110205 [Mucilaginibacter gossypiicola]|uniref:ATPase domain-containing protein n=1 Tax=Mucilaginibacter gossypiicola TaxID=551995 RepID=A0A1H8RKY0_9SPHI|nr:hypothetical protein [Mucilaginibacter gossypiicola]SEO67045.1 hypothetical protein SAMN05192574_110205 [Mucilaginibacter gossypiicola]
MQTPFPLLPTIGTIPENQITGREQDIVKLLRLLRSQSVSVEEMRRMGKSLLLLKLAYLCNSNLQPEEFKQDNFKAKYFSFQGKQNLGEVINLLINELKDFKEWHQIDFSKTYNFIKDIFSVPEVEIGGAKFSLNLPEYKKSWKDIFFKTLEDIADTQAKTNGKLILIFDELPIMLWEWYKEGKHEEAIELLDILRERRQVLEKKGIRFIYCGSIGIKVVLNTFRKDFKYTGEPTNEMEEFSLKPFSENESDFLCECFILSGFNVAADEKQLCLKKVYGLSNGLPFYISTIFNLLQTEFDYNITMNNIEAAYELIINDTKQHKAFKQLIDRLEIYYPKDKKDEMMQILNILSKEDHFIEEELLYTKIDIDNNDSLKQSLYTLLSDHYLIRQVIEGKRYYKFKYQIFKEWWKVNIA